MRKLCMSPLFRCQLFILLILILEFPWYYCFVAKCPWISHSIVLEKLEKCPWKSWNVQNFNFWIYVVTMSSYKYGKVMWELTAHRSTARIYQLKFQWLWFKELRNVIDTEHCFPQIRKIEKVSAGLFPQLEKTKQNAAMKDFSI